MQPRLLTLTLASLLLAGCSFDEDHATREESEQPESSAKSKAESSSSKDEDLRGELEEAKLEIETSRLNAEVTALENAGKLKSAERSVADQQRTVKIKRRALTHFQKVTTRDELASSILGLDRSKHRRELAQDELGELEAMYAEEDLAVKTKELVLKRGRKSLEFSGRDLEIAQKKAHTLKGFDLPKRLDEKRHELKDAQAKLEDANRTLQKTRLEVRVAEMKAAAAISKAERGLAKLQKKIAEKRGGS